MYPGNFPSLTLKCPLSLRTLTSQLTYHMLGETRHRVPRAELN